MVSRLEEFSRAEEEERGGEEMVRTGRKGKDRGHQWKG